MVERFNALADRGNVDFEAWFSARTKSDRSWDVVEASWRFRWKYLPTVPGPGGRHAVPSPLFSARVPDVLVSPYASASFLAGWEIARLRGIRTAFWVEPTHDTWFRRRAWKERLKRRIFPRVDGIFTTGDDGRRFAERYAAAPERIFTLPYFAAFDRFAQSAEAARPERDRTREALGLRGVTFIYVGRFWWGKGLPYLLDAFAQVQPALSLESTLLLVGDGEEEEALRRQAADLGAPVVFRGFTQRDELPRVLVAADALVFPTLGDPFGLVVEEAMSCGLPVISTSAAGEIHTRIDEGVTGFVVPPRDADALRRRMLDLGSDDERRRAMGRAAAESVRGLTPTLWAELFEEGVSAISARRGGGQSPRTARAGGR
jgi:glycosyltransferase involved in cell wall biosynthesis